MPELAPHAGPAAERDQRDARNGQGANGDCRNQGAQHLLLIDSFDIDIQHHDPIVRFHDVPCGRLCRRQSLQSAVDTPTVQPKEFDTDYSIRKNLLYALGVVQAVSVSLSDLAVKIREIGAA